MRDSIVATLVSVGVMAGGAPSAAAPSPLPRKSKGGHQMAGRYVLWFGPARWVVDLLPGGGYRASCGGALYHGTWSADGRRLTVTEWVRGGGQAATWSVRLDSARRGVVDAGHHKGTEVRLEVCQ